MLVEGTEDQSPHEQSGFSPPLLPIRWSIYRLSSEQGIFLGEILG